MIAVDTNILTYAHRAELSTHVAAVDVMRILAESRAPWAIPWPCVHEFLAVVTSQSVFDPPSPLGVALDQVRNWGESPSLALLSEGGDHLEALSELLTKGSVTGPRVHDARIAAICLSHGVSELWTADRDFGRFPKLRTRNPLV
ncbi:MAG: TA system VapC family ribonuclease toxin [Actinomycetota bacterium]